MDLTIQLEDVKLNIRVAVILNTDQGYLFEKHKVGYYFVPGGRVKANESSLAAAEREIFEEIGYKVGDLKLTSIIENFFGPQTARVQEICFVYKYQITEALSLPDEFTQIKENDLDKEDIRPEIMKKIILEPKDTISHYIIS